MATCSTWYLKWLNVAAAAANFAPPGLVPNTHDCDRAALLCGGNAPAQKGRREHAVKHEPSICWVVFVGVSLEEHGAKPFDKWRVN